LHFSDWPEVDAGWMDVSLSDKWSHLRDLRSDVLEPIEIMRREKLVGSSLEAIVKLRVKDAFLAERSASIDLAELCIAADVQVTGFADDSVEELRQVAFKGKTTNHKCGRCWRHLPEVVDDGALCGRCADVVGG
jgi:isoleucyl-tRNA synthetase